MSYMKNIDVRFEPLVEWPGKRTANRKRSTFRASLSDTYQRLERELGYLGCKRLTIQADCERRMIRQDGLLRSDARLHGPGVILSFDSKHGPLSYPCDTYTHWDCNLRAIALALESLRAVDRYGVTKRAEQYKGWQQLPSPDGEQAMTVEQAAFFVSSHLTGVSSLSLLHPGVDWRRAINHAALKLHPDKGGDPKLFKRLMDAERIIAAYHARQV